MIIRFSLLRGEGGVFTSLVSPTPAHPRAEPQSCLINALSRSKRGHHCGARTQGPTDCYCAEKQGCAHACVCAGQALVTLCIVLALEGASAVTGEA